MRKEIEIWTGFACRTGKISKLTWSGKPNLEFEEDMQLRKDHLKLISDTEIRRKDQKWPCAKFIENSNLKDWNYTKRINRLISLKERRSACVENWN